MLHIIYYNFHESLPLPSLHDARENIDVRLMSRIIDNIPALRLEFFFWILTIDYVHNFIIPCISIGNTRKSNILSFQFATTHWHSSIRDVELEMWVSSLSSHLNEPWGMRPTQHFGCTLPTMCKADTVSASLPKGMLISHAFTYDQCKFDSLLLGFFQSWGLYLQTGIKCPAQSELIVLLLFAHLILSP